MSLSAFLSAAAGALAVIVAWNTVLFARHRPQPRPGEAICYKCRLTGGHDLRLEAGEAILHLRAHEVVFSGTEVVMSASWRNEDL